MTQATLKPSRQDKTGRTRMCILTRQVRPQSDLLRFVAGPDRALVPDLRARLPGRGVWVGLDRAIVAEAIGRRLFARALKADVIADPGIADDVAVLLRKAALGRLGLARKSGAAVTGFAKVEAALAKEKVAALLTASDAADDALRKAGDRLNRRARKEPGTNMFHILAFDTDELSLAMGRPNVVHAAVLGGPAGRSFRESAVRLLRYEGLAPDWQSGLDACTATTKTE
ncbi:MAG TPA: RNA-binding protein [Afifellaceae bacterium]|nr:RNA-binding protein [Afifellaceae bacterium]